MQLYRNIQGKKINFAGEPFETNVCHHPPMVFAAVYQARQKLDSGASSAVALEAETSGRSSKCCSFPGGVPAPHSPGWPQS